MYESPLFDHYTVVEATIARAWVEVSNLSYFMDFLQRARATTHWALIKVNLLLFNLKTLHHYLFFSTLFSPRLFSKLPEGHCKYSNSSDSSLVVIIEPSIASSRSDQLFSWISTDFFCPEIALLLKLNEESSLITFIKVSMSWLL